MKEQKIKLDYSNIIITCQVDFDALIKKSHKNIIENSNISIKIGKYFLDKIFYIGSNVQIIGEDLEKTIIELISYSNCHMITNIDYKNGNKNIIIKNITFEGNMTKQFKGIHNKSYTFACGLYFKKCNQVSISKIRSKNIRQTSIHFSLCDDVEVENFYASNIGWSGISTSGTSNISCKSCVIEYSGLDVIHSAVHMDGGHDIFLNIDVKYSIGNGIMIDSTFDNLYNCVISSNVSNCKRGISLSGSHHNELSNVTIFHSKLEDNEIGILVSNSKNNLIIENEFISNTEYAVLFQGKLGGVRNIMFNNKLDNDISEIHASDENFIFNNNKNILRKNSRFIKYDIKFYGDGICSVCGEISNFIHKELHIREGYKCIHCNASTRHRVQAHQF